MACACMASRKSFMYASATFPNQASSTRASCDTNPRPCRPIRHATPTSTVFPSLSPPLGKARSTQRHRAPPPTAPSQPCPRRHAAPTHRACPPATIARPSLHRAPHERSRETWLLAARSHQAGIGSATTALTSGPPPASACCWPRPPLAGLPRDAPESKQTSTFARFAFTASRALSKAALFFSRPLQAWPLRRSSRAAPRAKHPLAR